MQVAYGVFVRGCGSSASLDDAKTLAAMAIGPVTVRDTASGDGITLATSDGAGVELTGHDAAEAVTGAG